MNKRAHRRHQRSVKLAKRLRIVSRFTRPEERTYKCLHWHLSCRCFDDDPARRQREDREWRRNAVLSDLMNEANAGLQPRRGRS